MRFQNSGAGKRSYQKAQRKALRDGTCYYRGKQLSPAQLGCLPSAPDTEHHNPSQFVKPVARVRQGQKARATRLSYLSWNVGGLSRGLLDDIVSYMWEHQISISLLQETRWSSTREFTLEHRGKRYAVVNSGDASVFAGVMIIVDLQVIAVPNKKKMDAIRWEEPVRGRLLHMQIPLATHQYADLITCYQKRCASGSEEGSTHVRDHVWQIFTKS